MTASELGKPLAVMVVPSSGSSAMSIFGPPPMPTFSPIDSDGYEAVWDRSLAILLSAHQRVIRAALPFLRASPAPRIVNIASTEALGATAMDSPYAAAKAGVTGLTRALAVYLKHLAGHLEYNSYMQVSVERRGAAIQLGQHPVA